MNLPPGDALPSVRAPLPGAVGRALVDTLAAHECPGLTARRRRRAEASGAPHDPIVWSTAYGANVTDVDGNVYVDLTAGFGAALLGHSHPRVVAAVRQQSERMLHALGDVYPSDVKIALEARLAAMAPWDARVILGLSGADAVEAALKTARLHTGRAGVLAFHGAYHGLSYGTVALCGYREAFRVPLRGQLNPAVRFVPYPTDVGTLASVSRAIEEALATGDFGAVIVEPVLGRGGVVAPPPGFFPALREQTARAGVLLVADEIYTGLYRTGVRFRSVVDGCVPDVICLGKALGGGLPVSACLLREDIARAWGTCEGEAIHTSTFLGNPLACAAALAALDVLDDAATHAAIARASHALTDVLARTGLPVASAGLLAALRLGAPGRALKVMRALLDRGYVVLPGGAEADVLTFTPPCCITDAQLEAFGEALRASLVEP